MSTSYDLWCCKCGVGAGLDVNNGLDKLRAILPRLSAFAALRGLTRSLESELYRHRSHDGLVSIPAVIAYAAEHFDHAATRIRNEYGEFEGDCFGGSTMDCHACGAPVRCTLPKDHAGEHKLTYRWGNP